MEIKNFYDLDAWKEAHRLTLEVYEITKRFPKEEQFGIIPQLRRAASSSGANIAEGFERYHFKDKTRFYYQARGSVAEVQNFLLVALDLHRIGDGNGAFGDPVGSIIHTLHDFPGACECIEISARGFHGKTDKIGGGQGGPNA